MKKTVISVVVLIIVLSVCLSMYAGEKADGKAKCPACGRDMEKDWKFCPYDGTALVKKCPKCGKEFPGTYKFCPEDGAELEPPGGPKKNEDAAADDAGKSGTEAADSTKNEDEKSAEKTGKPGVKVETMKKNMSTTSYESLKAKLANAYQSGDSMLAAIVKKDRDFLRTAILWDDFYTNIYSGEEPMQADAFKKKFLDDLLAEKPCGLAKALDIKLAEKTISMKSISMGEKDGSAIITVKDTKTRKETHRILVQTKQVHDLWLVTNIKVEAVEE
jgi:hypothetical protein